MQKSILAAHKALAGAWDRSFPVFPSQIGTFIRVQCQGIDAPIFFHRPWQLPEQAIGYAAYEPEPAPHWVCASRGDESVGAQRFVHGLALGHILLGHLDRVRSPLRWIQDRSGCCDQEAYQAWIFTTELLSPEICVRIQAAPNRLAHLREIARLLEVPEALLCHRAWQAGWLSTGEQ